MTELEYTTLKKEIQRLEAENPPPVHTSDEAVTLYTLKAAALAYEQGLLPAGEKNIGVRH